MLIVFDIEATGLSDAEICQLSVICHAKDGVTAHNWFFAVDDMSGGAMEIHGLSVDALYELSGGVRFDDVAEDIHALFAKADLLIGHNVSSDVKYLSREFSRCGLDMPSIKSFCTMNYFTGICNLERKVQIGRPKPPKLEELIAFFGMTIGQVVDYAQGIFGASGEMHDARYDAAGTYLCLIEATKRGLLKGVL